MPLPVTINLGFGVSQTKPEPVVVGERYQRASSQPLPLTKRLASPVPEPELRSTYHDSFGGSGGIMASSMRRGLSYGNGKQVQAVSPIPPAHPSPRLQDNGDTSRLNYLEDRLNNQERSSQHILDRAMRIKEDVIDNLNLTHSTWQGEKRQRELLQDHIKSITDLVRKLDRDIKMLEDQLRQKDSYIMNSGSAIKTIELQQATTVTDMRGRIARCDAGIAKLVSEHLIVQDGLKQANTQHQTEYQRLQDKIQALELKVAESTQKFERSNTESLLRTSSKEGDLAKNVAVIETKLKGSIEELKMLVTSQKHVNETERERAVSRIAMDLQKQETQTKDKLEKLERKIEQSLNNMNKELASLRSLANVKDLQDKQREMEKRINAMVTSSIEQQWEKFKGFKNECRQGFLSVHESITNSKSVLEGKLTLSEEQLRKEIGHIKKMVILV